MIMERLTGSNLVWVLPAKVTETFSVASMGFAEGESPRCRCPSPRYFRDRTLDLDVNFDFVNLSIVVEWELVAFTPKVATLPPRARISLKLKDGNVIGRPA